MPVYDKDTNFAYLTLMTFVAFTSCKNIGNSYMDVMRIVWLLPFMVLPVIRVCGYYSIIITITNKFGHLQ